MEIGGEGESGAADGHGYHEDASARAGKGVHHHEEGDREDRQVGAPGTRGEKRVADQVRVQIQDPSVRFTRTDGGGHEKAPRPSPGTINLIIFFPLKLLLIFAHSFLV